MAPLHTMLKAGPQGSLPPLAVPLPCLGHGTIFNLFFLSSALQTFLVEKQYITIIINNKLIPITQAEEEGQELCNRTLLIPHVA